MTNWLTGLGYALSIVSVVLLAWVAWPAPGESQTIALVIIGGGLLSVVGMAMRWAAHVITQRKIDEVEEAD
ncbi:hypothetical protein K5P26_09830 [Sphingopyxis sp. XHP0097]|jgi:hypothetical protein|uniref:Uncharacterized protein n=1 Tax=Sphingopyxis jiangsuensis TaxID=2871171 RepID=A0ABS7MEP8_9SPHN|nr:MULTISPECIES: hypothetical protein [Sphingopyxis]MBL0769454.1 hypothetical protein [Sphingopyxis lutea]MBY4637438.1 hypothetical protein [Sphingopyxis jiangsuensis]